VIVKVYSSTARVIYQVPDENEIANPAILAQLDSAGTPVLSQEDRDIVLDRGTIPELIKLLKILEKAK
jgi:hypothetical protein